MKFAQWRWKRQKCAEERLNRAEIETESKRDVKKGENSRRAVGQRKKRNEGMLGLVAQREQEAGGREKLF